MADSQNMGKRLEKEKADKTFPQKKIKISSDFCNVTYETVPTTRFCIAFTLPQVTFDQLHWF